MVWYSKKETELRLGVGKAVKSITGEIAVGLTNCVHIGFSCIARDSRVPD